MPSKHSACKVLPPISALFKLVMFSPTNPTEGLCCMCFLPRSHHLLSFVHFQVFHTNNWTVCTQTIKVSSCFLLALERMHRQITGEKTSIQCSHVQHMHYKTRLFKTPSVVHVQSVLLLCRQFAWTHIYAYPNGHTDAVSMNLFLWCSEISTINECCCRHRGVPRRRR